MKTILLAIGITLAENVIPHNFFNTNDHNKDLVLIPSGTYENKTYNAFWMSEEISNADYREFVNYANLHPNDTLGWQDDAQIMLKKYSEIAKIAMPDTSVLSKQFMSNKELQAKYKNYYSNHTFDKYPVMGVSQMQATIYCAWRTYMDNKFSKKYTGGFRLPSREEWLLAAGKNNLPEKKPGSNFPQPVSSGKANEYGLYNMLGNMAEWTSTIRDGKYIAVGNSWVRPDKTDATSLQDRDRQTCWIGFRIVETYLGKEK